MTAASPNAHTDPPDPPVHGARLLQQVSVDSYSLPLEDEQGLVGDQASETAFRQTLQSWHIDLERTGSAQEALGEETLSEEETVRLASKGDTQAMQVLTLSIGEFSGRLAAVIRRFGQHPTWAGVERIVVGGGFKENSIGKLAIRIAQRRLLESGVQVELRTLHHSADDGGLVGWMHLHPLGPAPQAFLAVDIGGTNVRCGIVAPLAQGSRDACVLIREKWRHAQSEAPRKDLVEGIVEMLDRLIGQARHHRVSLLPFVGVACPGVIRSDGSIESGAQNLPLDWQHASFHLPRRIGENITHIEGEKMVVLMHNDAVVQGLSEVPFTRDVRRWAALTIGTGLGNASFTNRFG